VDTKQEKWIHSQEKNQQTESDLQRSQMWEFRQEPERCYHNPVQALKGKGVEMHTFTVSEMKRSRAALTVPTEMIRSENKGEQTEVTEGALAARRHTWQCSATHYWSPRRRGKMEQGGREVFE
jgi:hypothetical protein